MDFDPLQLGAVLLAAVLVPVWARRRFAVPTRSARPWLGVTALVAVSVAAWLVLTVASEDGFLVAVLLLPVVLLLVALRFFRWNAQAGRPVPAGRLVFGNLLVLAVPVTLAFAAGELWFRFVRDTTDSIGYTKVARRWLERHYRFNKTGFRDDIDYELRPADGSRRVSFVGDSFTAGHGIADVGRRCANLLRGRHPDWEVHVLAQNGNDTQQEVELLRLVTGHGYVLDEVVLVYCLNDVMALLPDGQATMQAAGRQAEGRLKVFDSSYLLDTLYYRLAIARLPGVGDYFSFIGEAYRGQPWEHQQARLRALRAVVEQAGGRLSVVTWPFLHALGPDYAHAWIHAQLAAFWQDQGVAQLDLLPYLRGHAPAELVVNSADAHPNERASELAAAAIEPWLLGVLNTPKPKR